MKPYLQPYKGKATRHTCPKCGAKNSFTLYLDGDTHEPIHTTVGICNRASKCGYHYPPKQFFIDNPNLNKIKSNYTSYNPLDEDIPINYISYSYVKKSESIKSNFIVFLQNHFSKEKKLKAVNEYHLGATHNQEVIFWQIDFTGKVRTGKIMQYNPETGKRIKHESGAINWVHNRLKKQNKLSQDFNLAQCFFGEHLIKKYPDKTICIVEAEKTAVIASIIYPQYIWLAAGNINGLSLDKCLILSKKKVIFFPDLGIAYEKWKQKVKELTPFLGWNAQVSSFLMKTASQKEIDDGLDIADFILEKCYT